MKDIRDRGHPIRFGIVTPQAWRSWDQLVSLWSRADAVGWDSCFLVDHLFSNIDTAQADAELESGDCLEVFTLLAALARETRRVAIGSFVCSITYRPPALLLKAATTVDHVSYGRIILGIGAGWNQREHESYGLRFPAPHERVALVGETLRSLRRMEECAVTDVDGNHLRLRSAPFEPKPVRGRLPVLIGSRGKQMLKHLARYADMWDIGRDPDMFLSSAQSLANATTRVGRDGDAITWVHHEYADAENATPDGLRRRVEKLAPLGVSQFLLNLSPGVPATVIDELAPMIEDLRRRWNGA